TSTPRVMGKCFTTCSTRRRGSAPSALPGVGSEAAIDDLPGEVAGGVAVIAKRNVRWDLDRANLLCQRTARVEGAAGRNPRQVRRQAADRAQGLAARPAVPGNRVDEGPCVRVAGMVVDGVDACVLGNTSGIHHAD